MGIEHFDTFIITALFFTMTPGIDTIFVLNKSIGQGKRAGFYAALGINTGVIIHTLFAALGFSIIIAKSAIAFSIVKYIGAAYLIYLGMTKFIKREQLIEKTDNNQHSFVAKNIFVSGFITNTLNPKVALFFLAFFPQFIAPTQIENPVPFIILGITYAIIGLLWFLILTFFAGRFSKTFQENPEANHSLNKFSGGLFILMGLKIALTKN